MATLMYRSWWSLVLRGIVVIGFGVMAIVWPDITLAVLIALFGAFVLIDGLIVSVASVANREAYEQWWLNLLGGLASIGIGIMVFAWPAATALVLLYLIAAWAVVIGFLAMIAAVPLRKEIHRVWLLLLGGLVSLGVGIALFAYPLEGALAIIWLIGAYAIAWGLIVMLLGFRVRAAPPAAA